jgi:hypothetical protein
MDLMSFVAQLERDRMFEVLVNAPQAQFGSEAQPYIGATIMPERQVPDNSYRETAIRYMTTIAGWGTRYSPVQRRDVGEMYASFLVELGDQDIGADFTSRDYDALVGMLRDISGTPQMDHPGMQDAANRIFQWADIRLLRGVLDLNERDRWSCMIAAQVVGYGSNGTSWTIDYANPANHRANAGGTWSNPAYDPMVDIFAMADLLIGKGYTPTRIITSTPVLRIFQANAKIITQSGLPFGTVIPSGATVTGPRQVDMNAVNNLMERNSLPPWEIYDRRYRDTTGLHRFIGDNNLVMLSTNGRDNSIAIVGGQAYLPNASGYFAIGRSAGQSSPGRVLRVTPFFNKPPRLEGECWQTGLPVFTEPESIGVIKSIS